jgi:hypothetical protein
MRASKLCRASRGGHASSRRNLRETLAGVSCVGKARGTRATGVGTAREATTTCTPRSQPRLCASRVEKWCVRSYGQLPSRARSATRSIFPRVLDTETEWNENRLPSSHRRRSARVLFPQCASICGARDPARSGHQARAHARRKRSDFREARGGKEDAGVFSTGRVPRDGGESSRASGDENDRQRWGTRRPRRRCSSRLSRRSTSCSGTRRCAW